MEVLCDVVGEPRYGQTKIRQEVYNQDYSAVEQLCIDKFRENYLLGDILGTMRNNVLKVSDILET